MRLSPLGLALAVALGVTAFSAGAQAKVLLVCAESRAAQPVSFSASSPLEGLIGLPNVDTAAKQIALVKTEIGYDVVLDWGTPRSYTLRERGYDILDSEIGGEMIHLLLPGQKSAQPQHFLFSFENEGFGEVVWTAPTSGQDAPRRFPCVVPR
jgi:hypothetical protein